MSHVSSVSSKVPVLQNSVKQNSPIRYKGGVEFSEERTEMTDNTAEERAELSSAKIPVGSKGTNVDIKV